MIHRDQRAEWKHWADYFDHVGLKASARTMRIETDIRTWTVPTKSPIEYEPDVALKAISEGDERRAKTGMAMKVSQERRDAFADRARELFKIDRP